MVKILDVYNLNYHDFNNIYLSFEKNMFYSIIGGNKSGKTTLFRLITGIIPNNNDISCNEVSLSNISDYIREIGVVERVTNNSFIYQKVYDEMSFPLYNLGLSKRKRDNRINKILEYFNVDILDKNINELDHYQRQLLLIMIALLHKPKVLLLDSVLNVFSNDDKENIVKALKRIIQEENITVINFTSSLNDAYFTDKFFLLSQYKIIGEYIKDDIYKDDKLFYQHGLEIPFLTDLSIKLKMYGILDKNYNDMKEMVNDIWP